MIFVENRNRKRVSGSSGQRLWPDRPLKDRAANEDASDGVPNERLDPSRGDEARKAP